MIDMLIAVCVLFQWQNFWARMHICVGYTADKTWRRNREGWRKDWKSEIYHSLLHDTGLHWVTLGYTKLHWVTLGYTELNWVTLSYTGLQ